LALAAKVFAAIVTDLAAAKEAPQIVASVQSIIGSSPVAKAARAAAAGACSPGQSRRLLPPNKNKKK
jgi:hypothetical protein